MFRSCKVRSKDVVMIRKIKFLEIFCIFKYVPSCSVVVFFTLVKNHNLLHFFALQILYLFHMNFLLKIGNKFEIF